MSNAKDLLDEYARRGKPHPRDVLEHAVKTTGGAVSSVEDLLKPSQPNDPAIVGARAFAMHLLGDKEVLGLAEGVIARLFACSSGSVKRLRSRIEQRRTDANFDAQVKRIIAAIKAEAGKPPAEPGDQDEEEDERMDATGNDDGSYTEMDTRLGGTKTTIRARIIGYKRRAMQLLEKHDCMSPGQLSAELGINLQRLRAYMEELLEDYPGRLIVSGERAARRYSLDGRGPAETATSADAREDRAEVPMARGGQRGDARRGRKPGRPPKGATTRTARREDPAAVPVSPRASRGKAMAPASGGGMTSLVQALTGKGGEGDSALMTLTDSGRRAVRSFVRGAAGGVVQDVEALLEEEGSADPERLERARGGLLFLTLVVEGAAAAPTAKPGKGKK